MVKSIKSYDELDVYRITGDEDLRLVKAFPSGRDIFADGSNAAIIEAGVFKHRRRVW